MLMEFALPLLYFQYLEESLAQRKQAVFIWINKLGPSYSADENIKWKKVL